MSTGQTKQLQNLQSTISRELVQIKDGGSAERLAEAIKRYQFSTDRTVPLDKNLLGIYFASLLLSNNFVELEFAVRRNYKRFSNIESQLYVQIAKYAKLQDYEQMINKAKQLKNIAESQLKTLFLKAVKNYILKSLAKNYVNIELAFLQKKYGITKQDALDVGCTIEDKFVVLKEEIKVDRLDELVEARIRQVSQITQSIARM